MNKLNQLPTTNGAFSAISVYDIDKAIAWYKQYLGFQLESQGANEHRKGALLTRPGAILEICEFVGATSREAIQPGLESHQLFGIFKLGFTTDNLDDTFTFLEAEGANIFFPIVEASDGNRTFGIKDIEGNIIQFFDQ